MSSGSALVDSTIEDASIVTHDVDASEASEIAAAEGKASKEVAMISLGMIVKSEVSLRDTQRNKEEYQFLCSSIRKLGVLNSILVRELPDGRYGLIDGLQRFSASIDVGKATIPARIVNMSDAEILEAQLITNVVRVVTKPAEQSKHLLRILARNPMMTKDELAERVSQSNTWVEQRLALNKLLPAIQELVDNKKINLSNAFALSMIPEEEQAEHVDSAISERPATFITRMKQRRKEIRDAKNSGKDAGPAEFKPQPHVRKTGELKEVFEYVIGDKEGTPPFVPILKKDAGIEYTGEVKEAIKAFLAWILNYDSESQQKQIEQNELRKQKSAQKREELKAEKEAKKREQDAVDAADITKW